MDELPHAGGQQARSPARRGQLFAALVAAATGIGYTSPSSVATPSPGSPPGKPANSIGVRMIKAIRTAVEAIPEDAWQRIDYPADGEAHIAQTTYEH